MQLEGTENSTYFELLRLFAHGTWTDYKGKKPFYIFSFSLQHQFIFSFIFFCKRKELEVHRFQNYPSRAQCRNFKQDRIMAKSVSDLDSQRQCSLMYPLTGRHILSRFYTYVYMHLCVFACLFVTFCIAMLIRE